MRRGMPLAALLLSFLGSPGDGSAQLIPSPYRFIETRQEVGGFVGYVSVGAGSFGFGPRPGPVAGLRYGIHVNGPLSLEAMAYYLPTTRDVIDPGRPPGERKVGEAEVGLAVVEGSLHFSLVGQRTWHGLGPYLLAGGGAAFDTRGRQEADQRVAADDRFEFGTSVTAHLGAGVRWLPEEHLELRLELRLLLWQLDTPAGYLDPSRELEAASDREWVSGPAFTLGAAVRF